MGRHWLHLFAITLQRHATSPRVNDAAPCQAYPTTLLIRFDTRPAVALQVLAAYPTTIRRRILRHLYLSHVRSSYIFQGCRQKFLDALLGISKVRCAHIKLSPNNVPGSLREKTCVHHAEPRRSTRSVVSRHGADSHAMCPLGLLKAGTRVDLPAAHDDQHVLQYK